MLCAIFVCFGVVTHCLLCAKVENSAIYGLNALRSHILILRTGTNSGASIWKFRVSISMKYLACTIFFIFCWYILLSFHKWCNCCLPPI